MAHGRSSHAISQLVPKSRPAAKIHGNSNQMPSVWLSSFLYIVHLLYRHFSISLGSDFWCHSNSVLHNLMEVLCGNLFRHLLVILLSNWAGYKLDTTVSCMDHIAWTMLHSSTQNKAHLTGISHKRAEESDWWHLIKVPTPSQLVAIWGPAARLRGSFGHVPSDSSLQLVHLLNRHFLISPGSDFQCHSNGVLHNSIKVLRGNLFYLTDISHRRAEQSNWWHLIDVPMQFHSWSRFGDQLWDCMGAFGHVPSDSSLQLVHLPYRHFLILLESDFWCCSNGVLHYWVKVLATDVSSVC